MAPPRRFAPLAQVPAPGGEPAAGGLRPGVVDTHPSDADALIRVLLIADSDASQVASDLGAPDSGFAVRWVRSVPAGTAAMATGGFGCLVVDPDLSGFSPTAIGAVRSAATSGCGLVLLPAEPVGAEAAAHLFGAHEFVLPAEVSTRQLRRSIVRAVQSAQASRDLELSARRLAAATAGATEAMLVIGPDARVESVSAEAELLTGTVGADAVGRLLSELPWSWVDRDGEAIVLDSLASLLAVGRTDAARCGHLGVRTAGQDTIHVFASVTRLPTPGGVVVRLRDSSEHLAAEESARFRTALIDAVGAAVVVTDPDAIVTFWNPAAEQLYGWTAAEALGRPVIEVVPAADPEHQSQTIRQSVIDGTPWSGDYLLGRRDGSTFPALVSVAPVYDDRNGLVALIGVSTDITERKRGEESARVLSAIVESTADAVFSYDPAGTVLTWNRGAEELYGYPAADIVGSSARRLAVGSFHDVAATAASVAGGATVRGVEMEGRHSDGSTLHVLLTACPIYDQGGAVVATSVIAHDIQERRRLQRELSHQALHDDLTGLPNRALLDDRLAQTLASCIPHGRPVTVLFLDLDQFKTVNDTYGHLTGDGLLVEVAQRLTSVTRPTDTVARFGGDEFVVVCADTGVQDAMALADRIKAAFRSPVEVGAHRLQISTSIGIAVTPPLEADAEGLLRCADAALYDAKAKGRARATVFDGALAQRSEERRQLSLDLRQALADDALQVHYQPVVALGSGHLVGLEALARWRHPTRGWVPPEVFVALAEQNGLSLPLDTWVMRRACRDAAALRREGILALSARMAVNLSASNVGELGTVEMVREAAAAARLPLDALELEITETSLLSQTAGAREVLSVLRALGVTVALDDFGTGYSSLTNLLQLPVTTVKIDRSFVHDITDEQDGFAIAASVINLGRALGLRTVAEGVETPAQLLLLHRLGCQDGQGYLWSEALPLDRVRKLSSDDRFRAARSLAGTPLERHPISGPAVEGPVPASPMVSRKVPG